MRRLTEKRAAKTLRFMMRMNNKDSHYCLSPFCRYLLFAANGADQCFEELAGHPGDGRDLAYVAVASRASVYHHFTEWPTVQVFERGDLPRQRRRLVDDGTNARGLERVVQSLETPPAADEHAADGAAITQQRGDVGGQGESFDEADQRDVAIPGQRGGGMPHVVGAYNFDDDVGSSTGCEFHHLPLPIGMTDVVDAVGRAERLGPRQLLVTARRHNHSRAGRHRQLQR